MARKGEDLPSKPEQEDDKPQAPKVSCGTIGNQLWRLRVTYRAKELTPDELWKEAVKYFKWCDDNPWLKYDTAKSGDNFGSEVTVKAGRPYTISGLCIFLGISRQTFENYSGGIAYQAYFDNCNRIREIIYTQKFEGAALGLFNANIIARDLGLVERQERDIGNKGNEPFKTASVTAEITPDMDEKTASQIYRSLLNPPKPEA